MLRIGTHAGPEAKVSCRICIPERGEPFPVLEIDNLEIGLDRVTAQRIVRVLSNKLFETRELVNAGTD